MAEHYGPPTGKWEGRQQEAEQQRTVNDKIARLRERVKRHENEPGRDKFIVGVVLGILDLLGDEL